GLSADSLESGQPRMLNAALHTSSSGNAAIRHISVVKDGDVPEVLVLGSGSMNYHDLRLSKPARLVLDFPSERIATAKKTPSNIEPIRDVRAAQFSSDVARVVIDLSVDASYSVKHVDGGVAVEFASSAASGTQAPAADPSSESSSNPQSQAAQTAAQPSTPPATADKDADAANSNFPKTTAPMSSSSSQAPVQPSGFDSNASAQSSSAMQQTQDSKPVNPPASQAPAEPVAPAQAAPVATDNGPAQSPQEAAQSAQQQASQAASQSVLPAQTAPAGNVMPSPAPALSPVSVITQDQTG